MPRPLMAFVYAQMRLKGELLKRYPDDITEIPRFDLVIGGAKEPERFGDAEDFPTWHQTRFGEITHGNLTLGGGRFLYKLHDVVVVQGGPVGPYAWYIVLEPGVCAIEASPKGNRGLAGAEGITISGADIGTVAINLMPTYEVEYHEKEPAVFHAHAWENNYFHRVMDSLPRGWAEAEDLVPAGTRWHHRDYRAVHYDTLYFPSFWPSAGYSPHPVKWLRERLKRNPARPKRSVLYLSRADASKRRITNEDEVVKTIMDTGFFVARKTMKGLALEEQVALAERHEIIIGPHGAALTNAIFANDATVIEFVPEKFQHPVYGYLSKWAGNRYCRIICPGDRQDDLSVDIDHLLAALAK